MKADRFQNVISSFQIAFTIVVIVVFYMLQGVMKSEAIKNIDPINFSWIRWTPPYWLAACWTWIGFKSSLAYTTELSALAILAPVICLWVTIRWLSPSFMRKLGAIDGAEARTATGKKTTAGSLYNVLADLLNKDDAAKAGFIITWLQTTRNRSFKMKVYPALVYIPVYFFYLLLMSNEPLKEVWAKLPGTKQYLTLLYMSAFALIQAMNYVTISDQYKAAWIYYSSPVTKPGHVMAGAFKALWIKYYLPFILLIGLFVTGVWGMSHIIDVVLATVNVSLFSLCIMRLSNRAFPFSIMEQMKNTGGRTIVRVLSTFILIGILGLSHYLAFFWWLKILFLTLSSLFFWLVWDSYKNTDWNSLRVAEEMR